MHLLVVLLLSPALAQQGEEPPPTDEVVEELPIVVGPQIVAYVEAAYPEAAKAEALEGTVLLLIELDAAGAVVSVEVSQPAGHGFDEAAVAAVQQMSFSPAETEEGPVPVVFEFAYGFTYQPEELPVEEAAPPPVNFDGDIREMGTRRPIPDVRVVVGDLVAITDAEGRFEMAGVPTGLQKIRLLGQGYVENDVALEVVEGEVTSARLWMRSEVYRANEAVGLYAREKQEVTRRTISIEEVRRVPGTFGDPVRVVQTLPGAARSPFGTGFLIIRGSNPEDSGVYIDGIRIPIIYHLTGTTSVLSPDLIASVDYLPGGFGVQYGRSMGGVIDVKTRTEFDKGRFIAGADILDAQVYWEGRLGPGREEEGGGHGLAVGARRSYIDAFIPVFTAGSSFRIKPRYWDYQVKWVAPKGDADSETSAFVYGFNDLLALGTPDDFAQGSDQDTQGDLHTIYASHRALMRFTRSLSETVRLDVTPSIGIDYSELALGDEFALDSTNIIYELRAELPWQPTPAFELVPGMDFIGGVWTFDFRSPLSFTDIDDPLAERDPVSFDGNGTAWGPDFYLKANLHPLADYDRWLVTPGIRYNLTALTYAGGVTGDEDIAPWVKGSFDPRLATRFALTDKIDLKGSSGVYHQPPQPQESVGVGTTLNLGYERSWATSVGFEQRIGPAIQWDIDLFYKAMDELIVFDESWTGFGDEIFTNDGSGRAYGLEVMARHNPTGNFFGWISYTLSRSERRDSPDGDWYPFDFDQRHILSAQAGYDLPRDFGVSAQVQFVTGNPTTPYNAGIYDVDGALYNPFQLGGWNGERLPAFFQSSVRFDKLWTFKGWQLETYADFLNVVRGVNPEFTIYNYDYSDYAYVRGLPFIPNVGLEVKFFL